MAVRLFILQAQYRKPVDFTDEALSTATNSWETLKEGLLFGNQYGEQLGFRSADLLDQSLVDRFKSAVDDDFNFAGGLVILFEIAKNLIKEGNTLVHQGAVKAETKVLEQQWQTLIHLATILGFVVQPEDATSNIDGISDSEIEALIQQRHQAKSDKNYAESDRIRDELQAQGITLIDKPGGVTIWNRG